MDLAGGAVGGGGGALALAFALAFSCAGSRQGGTGGSWRGVVDVRGVSRGASSHAAPLENVDAALGASLSRGYEGAERSGVGAVEASERGGTVGGLGRPEPE